MNTKTIAATAILIATASTLTACGSSQNVSTTPEAQADAREAIKALNAASSIELHKSAMSWNDSWEVKADGKKIATIQGLTFKGFSGDTYTMLSPRGGIMGAEDEDIFNLTRTAQFYGANGAKEGTLTKDVFSMLTSYHLKDSSGNDLAKLDERMGMSFSGDVKDAHGNAAWHFDKDMVSWGDTLRVKRRSGDVDAVAATLMVAVANEVNNAESKQK